MSAWTYRQLPVRPPLRSFHLVLEPHDGRAFGADSGEKHEPAGDIDTPIRDSQIALDPNRPIREADIECCLPQVHCWTKSGPQGAVDEPWSTVRGLRPA
jgi:hypothetical protein